MNGGIILNREVIGYVAHSLGKDFYAMPFESRAVLLEIDLRHAVFIDGRQSTVEDLLRQMQESVCYDSADEMAGEGLDPRI